MKKIFYLIIGVLSFVPLFVKADMSSPMIIEYKASVTNPDGAYFYEWDSDKREYVTTKEKLSYGKEITILYEENEYASPDGYSGYLRVKDITPIEKNYNVALKDLEASQSAMVLKDLEIKTGPAEAYEGTGIIIKTGTNIKIRFFKAEKGENPWVYVEYSGTKGFINILDAAVAYKNAELENERLMTNKNAKIIDPFSSKVLGTIKTNTIVNSGLMNVDPWSRSYYITYNGVSGLVSYYDFVYERLEPEQYSLLQKFELHETSEKDSKVIGNVESGTSFNTSFVNWDYDEIAIFYEIGSTKGWILTRCDENGHMAGVESKEDSEIIEEHSSEESHVDIEKPVSNPRETLYICIGGAIVLSITAIIILILVNKKKKVQK